MTRSSIWIGVVLLGMALDADTATLRGRRNEDADGSVGSAEQEIDGDSGSGSGDDDDYYNISAFCSVGNAESADCFGNCVCGGPGLCAGAGCKDMDGLPWYGPDDLDAECLTAAPTMPTTTVVASTEMEGGSGNSGDDDDVVYNELSSGSGYDHDGPQDYDGPQDLNSTYTSTCSTTRTSTSTSTTTSTSTSTTTSTSTSTTTETTETTETETPTTTIETTIVTTATTAKPIKPTVVSFVLYADCETVDLNVVETAVIDGIVAATSLASDDVLDVQASCGSIEVDVTLKNEAFAAQVESAIATKTMTVEVNGVNVAPVLVGDTTATTAATATTVAASTTTAAAAAITATTAAAITTTTATTATTATTVTTLVWNVATIQVRFNFVENGGCCDGKEMEIQEAVIEWLVRSSELTRESMAGTVIDISYPTTEGVVVVTLKSDVTLDAAAAAVAAADSAGPAGFNALLIEEGIEGLLQYSAAEVQTSLAGAPVDDASANANKGATIAGAVVGGIAGLILLYLIFLLIKSCCRGDDDTTSATTTTTSYSSKSGGGGGGGGGEAGEPSFGMSSMGNRTNSWVEADAGTAEAVVRETVFAETGHISFTQKKQPEWLNQYRYDQATDIAEERGGGGANDTRRSSGGYSKGAGFVETQLNASIPGAVVVEEETETVAVQLLRTKLEQGAIDRLEFEHIRAVMLRSMALTDGDQVPTAVAITDV